MGPSVLLDLKTRESRLYPSLSPVHQHFLYTLSTPKLIAVWQLRENQGRYVILPMRGSYFFLAQVSIKNSAIIPSLHTKKIIVPALLVNILVSDREKPLIICMNGLDHLRLKG